MTSERQLYIGLAQDSATAATAVGLLKLRQQGMLQSGEFAYGRRYLAQADAHALNPDHLPLQEAVVPLPEQRLRDGGALPLTLRDALPDSWGRKVLEAQQGRPLSDVDTLLLTNADRVGAMVFAENLPFRPDLPFEHTPELRPKAPSALPNPTRPELPTLEDLAEAARQVELGLETSPQWRRLLHGGGSLGGARPKATFVFQGHRHLAKFAAHGDEADMAVLEAASLRLAAACGIDTPSCHVQALRKGNALLVRRFDRVGPVGAERRLHYLSASAWLNVPYESSGGSYVDLAASLRRWSVAPERDVPELFRRMVFNLVLGNSDDHVKNHGVLYAGRGLYRLSPAFDLAPQLGGNTGYQELAILPGHHESSLDLALQAAPQFGLTPAQASTVVHHTLSTVAQDGVTAVRALGGDTLLAQRLVDFWIRQAKRLS